MRTYREYIHKICTDADLNDKESVTITLQMLAKEAIDYHDICMATDDKLQEVMSHKDYVEWATAQAKELFRKEVDGMADSDFKDFIIENYDRIVEGASNETD